jgi:glycosyltransferase involved in cell wall biosynthesis
MENKKVVFFLTGVNNGGIENYLLRFLNHQYNNFSEVIIFCKKNDQIELLNDFLLLPNVKVLVNKFNSFSIISYCKLFFFFKKEKPNSICDFSGNISALVLFIAKLSGINKRLVFYRNSSYRFKQSLFRLICEFLLKKITEKNATKVLTNSYAGMDFYFPNRDVYSEKYLVIYNGINALKFKNEPSNFRLIYNIPDDAFLIGHVGRFNLAKNHDTILKVALNLCKNVSNVYFILCGRDVDVNIKEWVDFHNLNEKVIILGNQSNVDLIYSNIDCFYFPSITEGQPNALIEAMVFDIPFVASNISPIKETVPLEYHSYLVDPYDDYSAVQKIINIYNNGFPKGLKDLVIKKFNSDILFNKFYKQL